MVKRKVGSKNRPEFLACKQHATYHWKTLDKGYNFVSDLIAIEGLHAKLCALRIAEVPIVGIPRLSLGSLWTKCHLDVALGESCREYYKGKGGGFPKFGPW
jgi:hypothetical protein